uniref:Glycosyltransferase family 1 protein n=1 Tax=Schlesneria paludicola TaxID=360056 RepID=A0A7C2P866_9PLAN
MPGRSKPRVVYAMTGAEGLCGGIATANKSALRAVSRIATERGFSLTVLSLHESPNDRPKVLPEDSPFLAFGGRQVPFAAELARHALRGGLVICDHVNLSVPVLPAVMLRRCRLVILAHGSEADDRMKRTGRWMFQLATKVLTNSDLTRRRLLRRLPSVAAETCHLGLSPDFLLQESIPSRPQSRRELVACDGQTRPLGDRVLLLVARMDATEGEKGHDAVLRALPALRERFPDVQAVFPGSGSGREGLIRLARELHVADATFLPGFVPTPELQDLYRRCYAFVMPSQQEGFGLVYLEAMNFGKPCIGCRDDGAEEVIVHEQTGLLISGQTNIAELAGAVEWLLSDPERAEKLGQQGFMRLHERFTSDEYQRRFETAIGALTPCCLANSQP